MKNPLLNQWLNQPGGLIPKLAQMRSDAGLDQKRLAELLGVAPSTVSRALSGDTIPSDGLVSRWARACGAEDQIDDLLRLRAGATQRHMPWRQRFAVGIGGVQQAYNELHRRADMIWGWSGAYLPGAIQTRAYARAIMTGTSAGIRLPQDVEDGVEKRMIRSQYVGDGTHQYRLYMSEAALVSGPLPDPALVVEQRQHLKAVAKRKGVDLRVVPLRHGLQTSVMDIFEIITVDGETFVMTEHLVGETEWTDPDDVERYIDLFHRIGAEAVPISDFD